jgi:hypothetical protein
LIYLLEAFHEKIKSMEETPTKREKIEIKDEEEEEEEIISQKSTRNRSQQKPFLFMDLYFYSNMTTGSYFLSQKP